MMAPQLQNDSLCKKRQDDKLHYAKYGASEEERGMLTLDSVGGKLNDERRSSDGPALQGHDMHDIELTVFERPQSGYSTESHQPPTTIHSLERGDREERDSGRKKTRVQQILGIVGSSSPQRLALIPAIVVLVIGVLLTVGLLPASFVYVEYYELALAKNRVSGKVNREDVYYPGCHLLTPDVELIRFQGTAHFVHQNLEIVTSDRLAFTLGISLQYFIKPEELGMLFTNYAHNYQPVVETMIKSTVKNVAVNFDLDALRLNRSYVEHTLRQAVALRLSGNCCPSCCPYHCSANVDCRSCRLSGRGCSKGIHMEVRYFQMGAVGVPDEVSERFLRQTILLIEAEKEIFLQKYAVVTKNSEKMQKEILNKAKEIREEATAEARKIRSIAEADYEKQVQTSYAQAIKKFYQRLNITREDQKLSLMYIRALEDISDNLYNLNYDQLTTFN